LTGTVIDRRWCHSCHSCGWRVCDWQLY
jgi:hypothetical protein